METYNGLVMSDRNNPEYLNPYDPQKYWENSFKSGFDIVAVGCPTFNRMYNDICTNCSFLF